MRQNKTLTALFSAAGMLILILDSRTALQGASDGITLCLRSVIPSLFPFIVLSVLITSTLYGSKSGFLRPLGALCGIPRGGEHLLAVGLLGGYPVGAQSIAQAYRAGQLSREDSIRMLGFCSNAGPAFIFGMIGNLFSSPLAPWALWLIHIISSLMVGAILPRHSATKADLSEDGRISIALAVQNGVKTMGMICGWVILFRIIISFCDRWFLWLLPETAAIVLSGSLELTNGCVALGEITQEGLRFILCGCFLSFGGICVWMQTVSVTGDLVGGLYLPGKLMQCAITFLLCTISQNLLFSFDAAYVSPQAMFFATLLIIIVVIYLRKRKITVAFPRRFIYNGGSQKC